MREAESLGDVRSWSDRAARRLEVARSRCGVARVLLMSYFILWRGIDEAGPGVVPDCEAQRQVALAEVRLGQRSGPAEQGPAVPG